jgi:hypothetical protein
VGGIEQRLRKVQSGIGHGLIITFVTTLFIFLAIITDGWITPQFVNAADNLMVLIGMILSWGVPLVLIYLWVRFILIEIKILFRRTK